MFQGIAAAKMAVYIENGFPENEFKVKPFWVEKIKCEGGGGVGEAPGGAAGGVSSDSES